MKRNINNRLLIMLKYPEIKNGYYHICLNEFHMKNKLATNSSFLNVVTTNNIKLQKSNQDCINRDCDKGFFKYSQSRKYHDIVYCQENFTQLKGKILTNKLTIFSDFDFTITNKYTTNRQTNLTSVSILQLSKIISQNFKKINDELFNEYHSYEENLALDKNIRQNKIVEWYYKNLKAIVNEKLTKEKIKLICEEVGHLLRFRAKFDLFLDLIHEKEIPFVIITAGLRDSVEQLLMREFGEKIKRLQSKNLFSIYGNELIYDQNGESISHGELVTTFNKGKILLKNCKIEPHRDQYLMLGDHIWDADAINYFDGTKFRLGFCNFTDVFINENLKYAEFVKRYNLIVINDGTFSTVTKLLE